MKKRKRSITHRAYHSTRSLIRLLRDRRTKETYPRTNTSELKIAFIHSEKRITTGAHHINELMAQALDKYGVHVRNFYPRAELMETPTHLRGIANILFFHSLLEHKKSMLGYHIIQGTTYTTLPFLSFNIPTVAHFGSTTEGFLKHTPKTSALSSSERGVIRELYDLNIIPELDFETMRPLKDIADMEKIVARRATACIATSRQVKNDLISMKVPAERIHVIHNALEDYWFDTQPPQEIPRPHIIFLGRIGGDIFTLKLKGFDRLVDVYRAFPSVPKTTVCMTMNKKLKDWLRVAFPEHYMYVNLRKDLIPRVLTNHFGSILFIPSRYEGFSLSLIEGMSQGLVPIMYRVGVAPEVIVNGVNGFLVSTQEEAKKRIQELLEDQGKRITMAHAARKRAAVFTSEAIAGELTKLYRTLKYERRKRNINPNIIKNSRYGRK